MYRRSFSRDIFFAATTQDVLGTYHLNGRMVRHRQPCIVIFETRRNLANKPTRPKQTAIAERREKEITRWGGFPYSGDSSSSGYSTNRFISLEVKSIAAIRINDDL